MMGKVAWFLMTLLAVAIATNTLAAMLLQGIPGGFVGAIALLAGAFQFNQRLRSRKIYFRRKEQRNYARVLVLGLLFAHPAWSVEVSLRQVNDKYFLELPAEPAPGNMVWGEFGSVIETYLGIPAYSNGVERGDARIYQCTELVHRFLREAWGVPTRIGLGLGHGRSVASGIAAKFNSRMTSEGLINGYPFRLEAYNSGSSKYPPVTGSVVSMLFSSSGTGYGHVGIIRALRQMEDGSLQGELFDQHGGIRAPADARIYPDTVVFTQNAGGVWEGKVHSWKFQRDYPVTSWLNIVSDQQAL